MDPRLYKAAKEGDVKRLRELAEENKGLLDGETQLKETALHLALRHEREDFATEIAKVRPELVARPNEKGDTPFHFALQKKKFTLFIKWVTFLVPSKSGDVEMGPLLAPPPKEAPPNSPPPPPKSSFLVDESGKSLLYMAVEVAPLEVIQALLESPLCKKQSGFDGPQGMTALHAAVLRNDIGILREILKHLPKELNIQDKSGNTALHYAVCIENLEILKILALVDSSSTYVLNNDGYSPVHLAASMANLEAFKCLLQLYPESGLKWTMRNRNSLHLAVLAGRVKVAAYILDNEDELFELRNEQDKDGNTPLHLAVIHCHDVIKHMILHAKGVDVSITNNEGLTANEIRRLRYITQKIRLEKVSGDTSPYWRLSGFIGLKFTQFMLREKELDGITKAERVKDMRAFAQNLSVVAALITTITFAAAFAIPGGYKGEGEEQGTAASITKAAFRAFIVTDALAMCCSIIGTLQLIWAGALTEPGPQANVIGASMSWISASICLLAIAFSTGIYVMIPPHHRWIAIVTTLAACYIPCYLTGTDLTLIFHEGMAWITSRTYNLGIGRYFLELWQKI